MNTKKVWTGFALASSIFLSAGASAGLIGAWDWTSDGGFVNVTSGLPSAATCSNGLQAACKLQFSNVGVTPSGIAGTSSIMTWGTGSTGGPKSGLQAVFGASGAPGYNAQLLGSAAVPIPMFQQIITNGGWTNTGAAVHYNNVITLAGGFMNSAALTTTFQLLTPGAGPIATTKIGIAFNETPNVQGCPFGNPHSTVCDDIFTLTGTLQPVSFTILGQLYTLSFRFADGPGAIVQGDRIYTAERRTSVVFVQGRIDAVYVPLPGILALIGMGLVMLGWQMRVGRRRIVRSAKR